MKSMKLFLGFISLQILLLNVRAQDSIYVACWNVENLFDTVNDTNKTDGEFTPGGSKLWDEERLNEKMDNLAKVINYMNNGKGPDILGFEEIEHKYLIDSLAGRCFPGRNYASVSFESPDGRGIQNGIMYDADKFELIHSEPITVKFFSDYKTRDILYAKLKWKDDFLNIFVNHWPSRRGGEEMSRPRRINAASTLKKFIADSEGADENSNNIIIMGDFNDEPDNLSISEVLEAKELISGSLDFSDDVKSLYNLAFGKFREGYGTHLYNGEYNFLDQMIISEDLLDKRGVDLQPGSFDIVQPGFAQTERKGKNIILPSFHEGEYLHGFSDHYPVSAKFIFIK